jgi:hypothetical protein
MVIIEKEYSGLNKDILIDKFKYSWSFSDKIYNLNKLFQLENLDDVKCFKERYNKLISALNIDNPEWLYLLGNSVVKKELNILKNNLDQLSEKINYDYEEVLYKRINLTENISNCLFNDTEYKKPVYDHVSSVTGRTKITEGLNFLVMKKDDRKNLKSKYKNGRIYEIDIISLEPRILCKVIRNECYYDIYDHVAKNILKKKYDRKNVKLGLISTLYGAKLNTVKKLSGLDNESAKTIKNWFDIEKFTTKLNEEYASAGKIENFYGRNIYSNSSPVNYYTQSTAVDCAMISFYNYVSDFKQGVDLVATIHDAIIIDVHPKNFKKIEDTYNVYDDVMKIELPVKIKRLS